MRGVPGLSLYANSTMTVPSASRVLSSLARPRRSQADSRLDEKHSARNANTSNTVDFPLPLGPTSTVIGVICVISTSCKARKFRTFSHSIRGGAASCDIIPFIRYGRVQVLRALCLAPRVGQVVFNQLTAS